MRTRTPEFVNHNKICPVCNNPLTLYLQWTDSLLFKAEEVESKVYCLRPTMATGSAEKLEEFNDEHIMLDLREGFDDMSFSSSNEDANTHLHLYQSQRKEKIYNSKPYKLLFHNLPSFWL